MAALRFSPGAEDERRLRLRLRHGMSRIDLARSFGIGPVVLDRWMERLGLKERPRRGSASVEAKP